MMQPGMQAGIGMGPQRPPQGPPQGMQAPPPGGPQMPPPQPGMGAPQGADPMAMMAQMKAAPDGQLQQMVQSKHPLGSFALVMLNGRNQQRKAAQAQQMQQIANQPPVAQRVMQEAQQLGGVAALPTGQAIPQQYASGGIVRGFEGGGSVTAEGEYARLMQIIDPYASMYGVPVDTPQGLPPGFGRTEGSGLSRDIRNMYSGSVAGEIDRKQAERYRAEGRDADAIPLETRPPVSPAYRVEGANQPVRGANPATARPVVPPTAPAARSASGSAGISSLVAGKPGSGFPEWKDPTAGVPAARMTDAEWVAFAAKKRDELTALYGPSYADKYLKELMAEREALKAREPRAREEAWLTAGLRMMQGKSRHGLQNIGAGGEAGIAQYRADRTMNDEQQRALRREMMGLEATEQQRKDTMVTAGIGQADKRNTQMGQDRAERIEVNKDQTQHGIRGAMYALEVQKVQADMVRAQAAMKAAGAAAAANQDARMMNAVTMVEKRIDAAVKQRMAGHVFIQPGQEQGLYAKYYTEEFNNALATNPFFREAVTGSSRGATIDASGLGLGKKQ